MPALAVLLLASAALPQGTAVGPIAEEHYLKAFNPGAGDRFGRAVAIDGDTIAVGAPTEDGGASGLDDSVPRSGAVYVFVRSFGTWTQQAYLKAPTPAPNRYFGSALALDGDTLVVGTGDAYGSVTVFARSGGSWSQQFHATSPFPDVFTSFGDQVALDGDTLVVGSVDPGNGAGDAVVVYTRSGSVWSQVALLQASNGSFRDDFGSSVDVQGDTIVVGASGEENDAGGVNPPDGDDPDAAPWGYGAVYVFERMGPATWMEQAYLKAEEPKVFVGFGDFVDLEGDRLVVSAPTEYVFLPLVFSGLRVGAVHTYERTGGTWTLLERLIPPLLAWDRRFGSTTALVGDTLIVGSWWSENSPGLAGQLQTFERSGNSWTPTATFSEDHLNARPSFGWTGAASDGTIVLGLEQEAGSATGVDGDPTDQSLPLSGAALVFGFAPPTPGAATPRNAGANPASFSSDVPTVGQVWTAAVDLTTTGHPFAWIAAFAAPTQLTLPGGQTLLVDTTSSVEFLRLAPQLGPLATFQLLMPSDLSLSGLPLFSQAVHLGGPQPIALGNALDLILGN